MRRTHAWHVEEELATRYAAGMAAETDAWSLEKHVEACGNCAARVSSAVRTRDGMGAVLADIRADVLAAVPQGAMVRAPVRRPWRALRDEAGSAADGRRRTGVGTAGIGARWAGVRAGAARRLRGRAGAPVTRAHLAGAGSPAARARRVGAGDRAARILGARPGSPLARVLWAAGPALRGPWLLALVLVASGALALAYGAGLGGAVRPLLLVVAPVLPLAGVFVSYGRHADPLHEVTASTPAGGLRLLLTRTAAVLGASIPALTLAGAALPAAVSGPGAVAWLLPGLALTLAALALGSYVGCRAGAAAVAAGWAFAVALPTVGASPRGPSALAAEAAPYFSGPGVQGCWAAGALACAAVLAVRRRSFDHLETS
ncbi:zf-HC2 domain-containing protein [Streptomyces sp. NPDC057136]|uniref:zf-HC2 domain-containing protein n=1 Tax=Streptomyces sp. NPDC057136 TaxID=3346029 RepID=UPI0036396478